MKISLEQRLDRELLFSEKRRILILIVIFSAAMVLRMINKFYIKPDMETIAIESFSSIWLFPLLVILFELISLTYINVRIKRNKKGIPIFLQYMNVIVEICLPSSIILWVAREFPYYNVLESPGILIYFIFIILSTLRLNFWLSFFCGLLAASCYTLFSVFIYHHFNSNDAARSFILLFSGLAAGLVANQIKRGLNKSIREAEKRHRAENLFGQQISVEIAEKMLENDGKLESKRMNVAVMFIDIRNFSQFAADKSPEEIVQYQNAFFSIVVNCVMNHNGIINQFLGDGCMVTFGAPVALSNPGRTAVDAAREIVGEISKSGNDYFLKGTRVGIGIHTGDAVTGNIGTEFRQQYSITGNVVIAASRIEQLNKKYNSQILVSEAIVRSIEDHSIPAEFLDAVELKGMQDSFRIYKVA